MSMSLQAWADAMVVDKQLGPGAERHVADQVRRYTLHGDEVETARWMRIGRALNAIREANTSAPVKSGHPDFHGLQPVKSAATSNMPADR